MKPFVVECARNKAEFRSQIFSSSFFFRRDIRHNWLLAHRTGLLIEFRLTRRPIKRGDGVGRLHLHVQGPLLSLSSHLSRFNWPEKSRWIDINYRTLPLFLRLDIDVFPPNLNQSNETRKLNKNSVKKLEWHQKCVSISFNLDNVTAPRRRLGAGSGS